MISPGATPSRRIKAAIARATASASASRSTVSGEWRGTVSEGRHSRAAGGSSTARCARGGRSMVGSASNAGAAFSADTSVVCARHAGAPSTAAPPNTALTTATTPGAQRRV